MSVSRFSYQKPSRANYLTTLMLCAGIIGFFYSGLIQFVTYKTIRPLEFKSRLLLGKDPVLDPRLKIYSFDDNTFRSMKDSDLTIDLWLDVLEEISQANPKAILIDKIFGIAKGNYQPANFIDRMKKIETKIITGVYVTPQILRSQSPLPANDSRFSLQNWYLDSKQDVQNLSLPVRQGYVYGPDDAIAAGFPNLGHLLYQGYGNIDLFRRYDRDYVVPHWSLLAADRLEIEGDVVNINGQSLASREWQVAVNLIDPEKLRKQIFSMETVVYRAIDKKSFVPTIRDDQFVVILPSMFTGNTDMVETPYGILPGGYLMVAMVNSVLTGQWIATVPESPLIVVLFCLIGFFLSCKTSQLWGFLGVLGGAGLLCGIGLYAFSYHSIQLPWLLAELAFVSSALTNMALFAIQREIHAGKIAQALSGLVPGDRMKDLLANPQALSVEPVGQVVSIMFIDVVGFSITSKRLSPADAFAELKDLFGEITSIIHRFQGTIDKTLGDGLLCFFGYDILGKKTENHADLAVKCAMEIQRYIFQRSLKAAVRGRAIHPLRIGINSASVYIGNIGNHERFDFTLVGDCVIFAARLETACAPFKIMIGPGTKSLLIGFSPEHSSMVRRYVMIKHTTELHEAWEVNPFYESIEDLDKMEKLYWQYADIEMRENRQQVIIKEEVVLKSSVCRLDLLNYSFSGLGLVCDKFLAEGVIFNLTLDSPDGKLCQELNDWGLGMLTVEVCWGRENQAFFEHGVRYIGLNEQQRSRIFKLLEKKLTAERFMVRNEPAAS